MKAYRTGTKLKLGLIAAAVAIAVASLWFTRGLARQLQAQDQAAVQLWARAIEFQGRVAAAGNPYADELRTLDSLVAASGVPRGAADRDSLRAAVQWAETMPAGEGLDFVFSEIILPQRFSVPALITDSVMTSVLVARNVRVDSSGGDAAVRERLLALAREMDAVNPPIRFEYAPGAVQYVHYGESELARTIRAFPFVQLAVVGLFVLVGYLGFSYVRRSEQSLLWIGMAREAAHQLGTPLTSMMGWIELLRLGDAVPAEEIAGELEHDVDRLRRVADRFEKIGSTPDLVPTALGPLLRSVAGYMERRVPRSGPPVRLSVDVPDGLTVPLNDELFEWVVENLIKNALDAMEQGGTITVRAREEAGRAVVEVADTGKGMTRATARHVFRPGFSTKRRGWGLGLSLSRRIVEAYHDGRLEVAATRPGEGTTFRITLGGAAVELAPATPPRADEPVP